MTIEEENRNLKHLVKYTIPTIVIEAIKKDRNGQPK